MRLALMQPYFFPYIGYFSLIKQVDLYVVFDTVQYISRGWMDRNRILKPGGGWQYFSVPTQKHHQTAPMREVKIAAQIDWQNRILGQLEHYKKSAPYYAQVIGLLKELFEEKNETVCDLNIALLHKICSYLSIETKVSLLSEMNLTMEKPGAPDEWGLNVCKAVSGTTEYWNAPGGASFYDREKYEHAGIQIKFPRMILEEYPQKGGPFEPGLSILDVMMFNSVEKINEMMEKYEIL